MLHTDKELLEAYRNGETQAYARVYENHIGPLERFLNGGFSFVSKGRPCRYRGNVPGVDSEAVIQETFVRAFSENVRRNYDGERPFRNYLFSIAKNLVLREVQRRDRVIGSEQPEEAVDAMAKRAEELGMHSVRMSPERAVADGQLGHVTREFIESLSCEEREFFDHRFAQGLTQMATAEAMGVTRARIKVIEKKMRRHFLASLREHGYFVGYDPKPRWTRDETAAAATA